MTLTLTEQRRQINFRIEPETIGELDKWAKKLRIPRDQLMRNITRAGLDDLALADSLGLVSLVSIINKNVKRGKPIEEIIPSLDVIGA